MLRRSRPQTLLLARYLSVLGAENASSLAQPIQQQQNAAHSLVPPARPLRNTAAWSAAGSRTSSSSNAWTAWPAAMLGLAAAAAWHGASTNSLADADEAPQPWFEAAAAAAEQAVSDAFSETQLDWQRSTAQHSSTSSSSSSTSAGAAKQPASAAAGTSKSNSPGAATPPAPPTVSFDGWQLSVTIPLLPGVDLPALLKAVQAGVDSLATHSRHVEQEQQSWLLSTQRVQHWKLRRQVVTNPQDPSSNPAAANSGKRQQQNSAAATGREAASLQQLSVQVVVPLVQGYSPHEAATSSSSGRDTTTSSSSSTVATSSSSSSNSASSSLSGGYVEVAKAGPFTADELGLLSRLVAAANKPVRDKVSSSGALQLESSSYLSPWGFSNGPDRVLGGLGGALLGQVLGQLLSELQDGWDYDAETENNMQNNTADGWQRRMDRFLGGLTKRLSQLGGERDEQQQRQRGDGEQEAAAAAEFDRAWEEQVSALQQMLQREFQAMTPPDVIEWLHKLTDQEADIQQQQQQKWWDGERDGGAAGGSWPRAGAADGEGEGEEGAVCPLPLYPPSSAANTSSGSSSSTGSELALPAHKQQQPAQPPPPPLLPWQQPSAQTAIRQLEQLGAAIFLPAATSLPSPTFPAAAAAASKLSSAATTGGASGVEQVQEEGKEGGGSSVSKQQQQGEEDDDEQHKWGVMAGYEAQKQALEDCLLLPLKHPEVYERVSSRTRASAKAGGARPRAVLFEGPPGTGKTSTARVLAGRASLPLVYVPLEMLVSKFYGESEQNMAKIFKACEALGGCIIFLDELDSLATSRDNGDMHEASRRLLGVLLREIDGFNHREGGSSGSSSGSSSSSGGGGGGGRTTSSSSSDGSCGDASKRSVVIGATNRRQDLDAALLSRFDLSIHFGLPDEPCRTAILQQYAHQLTGKEREQIAGVTGGFSGRDLRDVCEQTERSWASRIIRGQVAPDQLPGVADYLAAVRQRREGAGRDTSGVAAATSSPLGGHTLA